MEIIIKDHQPGAEIRFKFEHKPPTSGKFGIHLKMDKATVGSVYMEDGAVIGVMHRLDGEVIEIGPEK